MVRSGKLEQKSLPLPQKCLHHGGVMFAGEVVILSPLAQRSGQIAVHDYVSPHLNVFHLTKKNVWFVSWKINFYSLRFSWRAFQ